MVGWCDVSPRAYTTINLRFGRDTFSIVTKAGQLDVTVDEWQFILAAITT